VTYDITRIRGAGCLWVAEMTVSYDGGDEEPEVAERDVPLLVFGDTDDTRLVMIAASQTRSARSGALGCQSGRIVCREGPANS
jgi:hypothetical protein